jgi:hypothetical protein
VPLPDVLRACCPNHVIITDIISGVKYTHTVNNLHTHFSRQCALSRRTWQFAGTELMCWQAGEMLSLLDLCGCFRCQQWCVLL